MLQQLQRLINVEFRCYMLTDGGRNMIHLDNFLFELTKITGKKWCLRLSSYVSRFYCTVTPNGRWNCSVREGVAPLVSSICTGWSVYRPRPHTLDDRTHSMRWKRQVRKFCEDKSSCPLRELNCRPSNLSTISHYVDWAIVTSLRRLHFHSILHEWKQWLDTASTKTDSPI